jgi:S-DNA-T family DNA segregation ATPase FtsK/SpoIIIE
MTDTRVEAYEPVPGEPDRPVGEALDGQLVERDEQVNGGLGDAESVEILPAEMGPPVDPPARKATFADLMTRADERRPVVPASLRSSAGRRSLLTLAAAYATHGAMFHGSRSPWYAVKVGWYAPQGLVKAAWRAGHWASAEEGNWHLRQHAANRLDADTWLALDSRRMKSAAGRWWVFGLALAALVVAVIAVRIAAPTWAQLTLTTGAAVLFARLGRPTDKPILDRAFNAARFIRLTAELTRAALVASGAGIKDGTQVKFNKEIYRDGPGYMAEVSLPSGVIATDVIDRRDYLAAGFQLPVAQVWPEPVKGAHPGVLGIWVADRPVDRMKQPMSPLLTSGILDYWGAIPYGDDVRMRPVSWRVDERNSLFGGMPGSGKTLAARNVALGAALDPLVRFVISELKGSGDMDPLEPLCIDGMYASGADDAAKERTMRILYWLDRECERRPPAIRKWAAKGLNSVNKLNRAIAEADPSLFPLLALFDEIQELFADPERGKEAKALLTSIVKRGRSQGIHVILATQRIDKESIPKGISSNVSNREALAVPSHVEVDLILGTGAYSRGARPTTFVPPADGDNPWAGWGYLAGRDQPVRASYIDNVAAEKIVKRALALRGERPMVDVDDGPDRDVLADVIRVFAHVGRPGIHWQRLAELLSTQMPELYAGITAEAISAQLRAEGVESVNVTVEGTTLKGCRLVAVEQAAQRRAISQ